MPIKEIAYKLDKHISTIYREIKRATYKHTVTVGAKEVQKTQYAPEIAHEKYRKNLKEKGQTPKALKDTLLKKYIECSMRKGYSPEAILFNITNLGLEFDEKINSVQTIYNYLRKGGVLEPDVINYLAIKKRKNKKQLPKRQKRVQKGTSIEKRDAEVLNREVFGHWEMDCIEGSKSTNKTILMLIERKTRYQKIEPLKRQNTYEVVKALNRIEKMYGGFFIEFSKA